MLLEIIALIIGVVNTAGVATLLMLPQKRREATIANEKAVAEQWRDIATDTLAKLEKKEAYISELHVLINKQQAEAIHMARKSAVLLTVKCDRVDCPSRRPPFGEINKIILEDNE